MPSSPSPKDKISARIKPKDTVILGLSGGPDSVFLLYQLLKSKTSATIVAAHVNYHLRGRDSDWDQKFVEKLCRQLEIPLEILEIHGLDSKKTGNLEDNCRNIRYDFFEKLRQLHRAKLIVVGHHLNDQLETFLLNLTRGSSLNGFRAMREYDENRQLFRPLLDIPKTEILAWLKKHQIKYRLDKTNLSDQFNRNLLRGQVIPTLQKINPNFLKTAGKSLQDLNDNLQIVEDLTNDWLLKNLSTKSGLPTTKATKNLGTFDLQTFLAAPAVMQKNILRQLYKNLHNKSLTSPTIIEILDTLNKNRAGLRKEFGLQIFLKIVKEDKNAKRLVVIEKKFQ